MTHLSRIEIWWIVLVQHFSLSHLDWLADTLKQAKWRLDAEDHYFAFNDFSIMYFRNSSGRLVRLNIIKIFLYLRLLGIYVIL